MEIIVRRGVPTAELVKTDFCGVAYDGGRSQLPWAAWWRGQVLVWKPTRKEAEKEYRLERNEHKTRS